jgi:type II secretory pathway pseudopilin PulG
MKHIKSALFKRIIQSHTAAGFTLVEILIAAAITSTMTALAVFSLTDIMQMSQKAESETLRRQQLNRALDFISDEVRMATAIAKDANTGVPTDFSSNSPPSNITRVLSLQIPSLPSGQRVIYYIADPNSTTFGPNVIYRWGPGFDDDGNYATATTRVDRLSNPSGWKHEPLVDLVASGLPASTKTNYAEFNPDCPLITPTTSRWDDNPDKVNRKGFYTCVDPNGKIADIRLIGVFTDATGTVRDSPDARNIYYLVNSRTSARSQ